MNAMALRREGIGFFSTSDRRIETPTETPLADSRSQHSVAREQWCEARFVELAVEDPQTLLRWIQRDLANEPALLTFAAEAAGRIRNTAWVVAGLLPLLRHSSAVVREGAIYGLSPHLASSFTARSALRELLASEPSPGVKSSIEEALASLG